jgi:hypothetical protein
VQVLLFWIFYDKDGTPATAILLPFAFFFSVLSPTATKPNDLIYAAYLGFAILILTLVTLGIGLVRKGPDQIKAQ